MIYNYMQIIPVPERNTCVQVCDEIHQIYIMQKIFNNVKWRSEHLVGGVGAGYSRSTDTFSVLWK